MSYQISFLTTEPKILSQYKDFFFDEYNYYFKERQKIKKEIAFSLNEKIISYPLKNWFRLTGTKHLINPLSCKGSMENSTGGRFNIGNINKDYFPVFPALYIGNGKETCIKEVYSGMEPFFNSKKADSFFKISGHIYSILDITKKETLDKFIKTIKKIKISKALKKRAKKLNLKTQSIQNITELKTNLYDINLEKIP
ncbi:MAG: RES family NAD+ phosphorylase [Bdellovibrionales bacterium]|nr:RES family NAD+ phosphorylase [Bdellovibrionales bacterium]